MHRMPTLPAIFEYWFATASRLARERGYESVHQLTTEEWGVRRFFVRAPAGTVVNIVQHVE